MLEKNHIKATLHKTHLETLKVIMENSRANWIVDANIRIANERLQHKITNGHFLLNDKIREILRLGVIIWISKRKRNPNVSSRGGKKYTREQLNTIFDDCFHESYDEILKRKASVEASIKTLCLSIVNIYSMTLLPICFFPKF